MEFDPVNETKTELKKEIRKDSSVNAILLFIFWIIYFGAALVLPKIVNLYTGETESDFFHNLVNLGFYIILYPIGFSLILIINKLLYKEKRDVKIFDCLRKPVTPPGWTAKWIFLTIGATYAASVVSSLLFELLEIITKKKLTEAEMIPDDSALGILTVVIAAPIFAPIFEELFFRGTLYRNVRRHGTWSMMLICGITFGIWHGNYPQFLFASAMGFFSCFLYEKTQSVIPSMIVHFIINSIGTFMSVLVSKMGFTTTDLSTADAYELMGEHPFYFLVLMAIGFFVIFILITWIVLLVLEIIYHKESFTLEKKCPEMSEKAKFWTYLSSPLMALAMLGMLGFTIFRALGGNI